MDLSVWTLAFLIFITPGIAFHTAFAAAARCRRSVRPDTLRDMLEVFFTALAINLAMLTLESRGSQDTFKDLAELLLLSPCAPIDAGADVPTAVSNCRTGLSNVVSAAWSYGVTSVIVAASVGVAYSKLVGWFKVPWSSFYGPLYPAISGFMRREILVTVLSKVAISEKSQSATPFGRTDSETEALVLYRGLLDELRLDHVGRIEYLCMRDPGKGAFRAPPEVRQNNHARELFVPIGRDENTVDEAEFRRLQEKLAQEDRAAGKTPMPEPRLIIEGEDIQNFFFVGVDTVYRDRFWRRPKSLVLGYSNMLTAFLNGDLEARDRWALALVGVATLLLAAALVP